MDVKTILKEKGFRFNRQFGQNFLLDEDVLDGIAEASGEKGTVVEVGAGAGTLTRALSARAKKVVAFEIDKNLKKVLDVTLKDRHNVTLIMGDVMKYPVSEIEKLCGGEYSVVANIPYYVTTPLIMNFLEQGKQVKSLTLTVQKEVAERLCAKEASKQYGAITVAVNAVADTEIVRLLPKEAFYPSPEVDSAVIRITLRRDKYDVADRDTFRRTVKAAFAMRRKTLANNLCALGFDKKQAEEVLSQAGLPAGCRGEQLSVVQFVNLSRIVGENL